MKTVKALVAFSNGVISMEQYEVRELPTDMANDLIAAGICVEAGGGSGGGVLVVTDTGGTLDKTWQEIYDAAPTVIFGLTRNDGKKVVSYLENVYESDGSYIVSVGVIGGTKVQDFQFFASSASGYPTIGE